MSKREKQKRQRRQTIIQIAKVLFLEEGVQNIQMQHIATAADIGIATLFRYFSKKEYLVIATTNALIDEMVTDIEMIVEKNISTYEKVENILDYYIETTKDPHLRLAKFFESFSLYEKIAEQSTKDYAEHLSARSRLTSILLTLADQGKQDGSLRSEIDVDLFIMTMIQNFSNFAFKSSLNNHDTNLTTGLATDKKLVMMKNVFLSYIRP